MRVPQRQVAGRELAVSEGPVRQEEAEHVTVGMGNHASRRQQEIAEERRDECEERGDPEDIR